MTAYAILTGLVLVDVMIAGGLLGYLAHYLYSGERL